MKADVSKLRVYRAPEPGAFFVCRTRWVGTAYRHEHARLDGQRVWWDVHSDGRIRRGHHVPGWVAAALLLLEREREVKELWNRR